MKKISKSRTTLIKKSEILGINYTYSVIEETRRVGWFRKPRTNYKDIYTIDIYLKTNSNSPIVSINLYKEEDAEKYFNKIKRLINDPDNVSEYLELTI